MCCSPHTTDAPITQNLIVRLRIRLIKKFARVLNGVDLEKLRVGECVELPAHTARMLLAEGWAVLVDSDEGSQSRT